MVQKIYESVKQHRLAWSWAVIIGLFLTVGGKAPVLPVLAGCILGVVMSVLRSRYRASRFLLRETRRVQPMA